MSTINIMNSKISLEFSFAGRIKINKVTSLGFAQFERVSYFLSKKVYASFWCSVNVTLRCQLVTFCIWTEVLNAKLSEKSNFDTFESVPTKARTRLTRVTVAMSLR